MPIALSHALKNGNIAKLKEPGRYADGRGLYLVVSNTGRRYWQFRATIDGKRKEIGIGSAHVVSLAKAREIATEWQELVRQGKDPRQARDADKKATITFEEAAKKTWEAKIKGVVKNPKHEAGWLSAIEIHINPAIGKRELRSLGPRELADALRPIWQAKADTARRLRQRMAAVFDWANASGYHEGRNPMDTAAELLPKQTKIAGNRAALPAKHLPDLMVQLAKVDGFGALALRFVALTGSRTNEVRGARWSEIDREAKTWTVPAERMKHSKPHVVPLSEEAIAVLDATPRMDGTDLIFPSNGKEFSENALTAVLKRPKDSPLGDRYGVPFTVHGLRSTLRDWAQEQRKYSFEAMEGVLAHSVGSAVERAYRRSTLLDERRELLDDWGRFALGKTAKSDSEVEGASTV